MFGISEDWLIYEFGPVVFVATLVALGYASGFGTGIHLKPREVVGINPVVPLAPSAPTLVEGVRAEAQLKIAQLQLDLVKAKLDFALAEARIDQLIVERNAKERLRAKWHRLYWRDHRTLKAFIANPAMRLPQPWFRYQMGLLSHD